ncbi:hypothetical protein BJF78_32615 [Pseudonocardia sp. CNS-139]|nr:hypothetical protein BJF78_32615 [Pseudonocardia sp. CNS-139]
MRRLALRTVVDLRDDDERTTVPAGFGGVEVRVLHRPLGMRALIPAVAADPGDDLLGALYCAAAEHRGPELAATVAELARPGALPALVHCTAGKDRTGVVVALALSSVGVPDEHVAADYALTATYLTAEFFAQQDLRRGGVHGPAAAATDLHALMGAEARSMLRLLRYVRETDGTASDFLRRNGASATDLDALRSALVEEQALVEPLSTSPTCAEEAP